MTKGQDVRSERSYAHTRLSLVVVLIGVVAEVVETVVLAVAAAAAELMTV